MIARRVNFDEALEMKFLGRGVKVEIFSYVLQTTPEFDGYNISVTLNSPMERYTLEHVSIHHNGTAHPPHRSVQIQTAMAC